jgi:hypothetical protein
MLTTGYFYLVAQALMHTVLMTYSFSTLKLPDGHLVTIFPIQKANQRHVLGIQRPLLILAYSLLGVAMVKITSKISTF